jgi:hypothetical protein
MFMILIFWSILQSILHVYYFFWEGKGESDLKRHHIAQIEVNQANSDSDQDRPTIITVKVLLTH